MRCTLFSRVSDNLSTSRTKTGMKFFTFSRILFQVYGILPLDGNDFNRFKCLEYFRIVLLPLPTFLTAIAQLAFFVINIRDLGKATVALYCGYGFLNAILGYFLAIYHRRHFFNLLNDVQNTVDRSKATSFYAGLCL